MLTSFFYKGPMPLMVHFIRPHQYLLQINPQRIRQACDIDTRSIRLCVLSLHTASLDSNSFPYSPREHFCPEASDPQADMGSHQINPSTRSFPNWGSLTELYRDG